MTGKDPQMSDRPATTDTSITSLLPELDALAAEAMAEWKVPAVTLAVVQNGETTLLKAWGQRDVEAGLPATPQTDFLICSITKTFTATALALLVDEGRLDWTKPVRDTFPNSGCMIRSRPSASRCATCSAIIPACRGTTGSGFPRISRRWR